MEQVPLLEDETVAAVLERARALHSSQNQLAGHHDDIRRLPIRLRTGPQAEELSRLLVSGNDHFVWVQCGTEDDDAESDALVPNPAVLFRFLRCLQSSNSPITELSLAGVGVTGEAFKALLAVLRSAPPPLKTLILDNTGLTSTSCTEVALAASESTTIRYLSVARNELPPECCMPLAQLIRRSRTLEVLDCSNNAMRSKGMLDLLVAVRDRELAQQSHRESDDNSVVVSVNKVNVIVTLNASGKHGNAATASRGANNNGDDDDGGVVELVPAVRPFELRVSDNTLTASETAVLILTELRAARVLGVPDTTATFTSPDEKAVASGATVPDARAVRTAMKHKVEAILESGGETSGSVTVKDVDEALMLAQIVCNNARPSVQLDFPKGVKHFAKADIIETFLQGVRDNSRLQVLVLDNAALSRAEMVPISKALNWAHPCIIRKLDLRQNALGAEGSRELGGALKRNRTVTTLDVSGCQLGVEGCHALAEALRGHPSLDRLTMGSNNIRSEGAHFLRDALLENTILRRLEVPNNKLGPKGATFVARLIAGNRGIIRMDVSQNNVRTAGMVEILGALKENPVLMRLDLAGNQVDAAEGQAAVAAAITESQSIVQLQIAGTGISTGPAIEEALRACQRFRSFGAATKLTPAVEALLQRNLDTRIALEKAVEAGDLATVQQLVAVASLYHLGRKTLLHHAVVGGPDMMRFLLGIPRVALQVIAKNPAGQTALHEAALHNSCDAAHLLLQAGAVASIRDAAGLSARDMATDPAFQKIMDAEESFVQSQRAKDWSPTLGLNYYALTEGVQSPLQVWKSARPVTVGSRFPDSTEPSHPWVYLKTQVAPPHRRSGYWSLDALQKWRDTMIFVVLVAWMYELLEIPFRWGYAPNPLPGGYWALALFMDLLFIFYFVWNMLGHRPSYEPDSDSSEFDWLWASDSKVNSTSKTDVQRRRRKRAQRLLHHKRQFVAMLLAAIPWDFVLFFIWLGYGPSHFIDPVVLDVIQGLRLMRCAIAIMSNEHFSVVVGALNLGWTFLEMSKMAIWFFYLINMAGAILFFAGRVALRFNQPSWLTIADFLIPAGSLPTQPVFLQYQLTMYYVTFGITNSPFPQANWFEAFLWCAEFLGLGLVFVATVFGVIIDKIAALREAGAAQKDAQDKIVGYCGDLNLPDKVERKIVKKWMAMGDHEMDIKINTIGEMISPLSRDLRKEITLHLIWNWIDTWQQRREDMAAELDEALVDEALQKRALQPEQRRGPPQLPAVFPFTLFWHTWMKKLCFHPDVYVSFLVGIVDSIDRKLFLQDDVIYDFEDPSHNVYMIISGSVTMRLGRVRSGKEVVECTLYEGDWFGWESLRGFQKKTSSDSSSYKPPRSTQVKALKNTQLWVVPGSKFRKLYERDNEARFDLQDRWLANMDEEVLAWALHHYPPEKLEHNPLVMECETPLEKEQMKQVLLKTMLRTGVKDKKRRKDVEQMVKAVSTDVANFKKHVVSELDAIRAANQSMRESIGKQTTIIMEALHAQTKLIKEQGAGLSLINL